MHFSNTEYVFLLVCLWFCYQNCDCIFYHMLYFITLCQKWLNKDINQSNEKSLVNGPLPWIVGSFYMHTREKKWPPWLLTVSSRWPKWSLPAVTETWLGPWLRCDLAVIEPWSYWRCSQPAVTSPWLSCDLAVTELWPSLAVTEPWSLGPGAVTTVVTVSSRWAHGELTVTIYFLMGKYRIPGESLRGSPIPRSTMWILFTSLWPVAPFTNMV